MLKRFNDFVFENFINESIVVFSNNFKKVLKNIDSPVARGLEEMESKDLSVSNNYIDIERDDKEKISFIPDRRAQQLLSDENREKFAYATGGGFLLHRPSNQSMFDALGYTPIGDRTYHPSSDEKGEVIKKKVSDTTGKTYVLLKFPGGETVVNEQNIRYEDTPDLFKTNRQSIRVGRGVRGLISAGKLSFTDSEVEQFVNKYKSEIEKLNDIFSNFELVSGDDISYWYNYENYEKERNMGQLSNSCMSDVPSKYFEIYTKNPDVCNLLILKTEEGNKIKGRALVWYLTNPDITFVDRIYCHADSDMELFRQYSKHKKWYYKSYNGSSSEDIDLIGPDGRIEPDVLEVNVRKGDYKAYPYLDTLQYLDRDTGKLSTEDYGDTIQLIDTDGGYEGSCCRNCNGEEVIDCRNCDGDGSHDCIECNGSGEVDCYNCDGDGEVDCSKCNGNGEIDGETCDNCDGDGKVDCGDCDGDGEIRCSDCGGDGSIECNDCYGRGSVDCPECC